MMKKPKSRYIDFRRNYQVFGDFENYGKTGKKGKTAKSRKKEEKKAKKQKPYENQGEMLKIGQKNVFFDKKSVFLGKKRHIFSHF